MIEHDFFVWFAGFLDGEGSLCLTKHHATYTPIITVSNTHEITISYICAQLEYLGVSYYHNSRFNKCNSHFGDKRIHTIYLRKRASVAYVLENVKQFLVTKRGQAELLLQFLEQQPRYSRLTERGLAIVQDARQLNRNDPFIRSDHL